MQIPNGLIDITRFEELFLLPITARQTILGQEHPRSICGRILGSFEDEIAYFNLLYDYSQQPNCVVLHQFNIQSQPTTPEVMQTLQTVLAQSPTVEQLVIHLLGQNLLPLPLTESGHEHYFQAYCQGFANLLQAQLGQHEVIETILYLQKYVPSLSDAEYQSYQWPKFVWYGPMTKAQAGLCAFVMHLHFDCLLFSPSQRDYLIEIFANCDQWSQFHMLARIVEIAPFPTAARPVVTTSAQQAATKFAQALGSESGFYRPWQLRHYQTQSLQLTTTFDEVQQMLPIPAAMRPGFKVEKNEVFLPVFFTKINGIETVEAFEAYLTFLQNLPNTIFLERFPFMPPITANYRYYLEELQTNTAIFLGERFMKASWWRYQSLSVALQKKIVQAMVMTLEDTTLVNLSTKLQERQADVLGVLIDLPDPFIKQLEQFDYAKEVPKVITLQTQTSGLLSSEDAIVLRFLHHLGYDIISLNPSSRSDLDRYIQEGFMQIHQLPQHWFEYPQPKPQDKSKRSWLWQRKKKVGT